MEPLSTPTGETRSVDIPASYYAVIATIAKRYKMKVQDLMELMKKRILKKEQEDEWVLSAIYWASTVQPIPAVGRNRS